MLWAIAPLITESLCPVGSWLLLLAYWWLSVAASLRKNIVENLICVWVGWYICAPQLRPKAFCFITSVLILVPLLLLAISPPPSSFAGFPLHCGENRDSMLGTTSIKLSALLKDLRRDQGRIWTGNLSTICGSASPVLPGRKILSLSTEYEFLAPRAALCLLFQAKWSTPGPCSNLWWTVCHTRSASLLHQGALGAAGQEPVVALALSPWGACMLVEPWQIWAQSLLPKINMNPRCSCVKVKGWTKLPLSS